MNDSTKRKEEESSKKRTSKVIAGAVGTTDAPGELEKEFQQVAEYWKEAVTALRGEKFESLDAAVERIVELASQKLPGVADNQATQQFMKEALLSSEEILETLTETLQIKG